MDIIDGVKLNCFTPFFMNKTKLGKIKLLLLLDLYGGLLTDNQQKMLSLFYEKDCSLSEIADLSGVSRQAVYDAVAKAETTLTSTEAKLGIFDRMWQINQKAKELINNTQNTEKQISTLKEIIHLTEG